MNLLCNSINSPLLYVDALICVCFFSKQQCQRVNVYKNDEMTWDYTVQGTKFMFNTLYLIILCG